MSYMGGKFIWIQPAMPPPLFPPGGAGLVGPPSPRGSHGGVIPIGSGEPLEGGGLPLPGERCEPPGEGNFQIWPFWGPKAIPSPPPKLGPNFPPPSPPLPPVRFPSSPHVAPPLPPHPIFTEPFRALPLSGPACIGPGAYPTSTPALATAPNPTPAPP